MKKHRLMGLVLSAALFSIFLPMALMLLWSVAGRWPWPGLLPETYSLRTIKELLTGSASLPRLLSSSILLALTVAVLGTGSRRHDCPGHRKLRLSRPFPGPVRLPSAAFGARDRVCHGDPDHPGSAWGFLIRWPGWCWSIWWPLSPTVSPS